MTRATQNVEDYADRLEGLLQSCVPFVEAAINDEGVQLAKNDAAVKPALASWVALLENIKATLGWPEGKT
jgi:hypothetical protein